jgi:hypothetical protein
VGGKAERIPPSTCKFTEAGHIVTPAPARPANRRERRFDNFMINFWFPSSGLAKGLSLIQSMSFFLVVPKPSLGGNLHSQAELGNEKETAATKSFPE